MTLYTNIHTHQEQEPGTLSIRNVFPELKAIQPGEAVSIGIHPWHSAQYGTEEYLRLLLLHAAHPAVKAIGECGLDRLAETDMSVQKDIFIRQVRIAEAVRKPLIIHCVRAFDELIRIKKAERISVPVIVHGYNSNEIVAAQLLRHNIYLSFGKALLNAHSNAQKAIGLTAFENFFLETDDAAISIKAIFEKAALLKQTGTAELKEKMMLNFKRVFEYE